jgi:hypothetical protein
LIFLEIIKLLWFPKGFFLEYHGEGGDFNVFKGARDGPRPFNICKLLRK